MLFLDNLLQFIWIVSAFLFTAALFIKWIRIKIFKGKSRKFIFGAFLIPVYVLTAGVHHFVIKDRVDYQKELSAFNQKETEEKQKKEKEQFLKEHISARIFDTYSKEAVEKYDNQLNAANLHPKDSNGKPLPVDNNEIMTTSFFDGNYVATVFVDYNKDTNEIISAKLAGEKYIIKDKQIVGNLKDFAITFDEYYYLYDKAKKDIKDTLKKPDDAMIAIQDIYLNDDGGITVEAIVKAKNSFNDWVVEDKVLKYKRK